MHIFCQLSDFGRNCVIVDIALNLVNDQGVPRTRTLLPTSSNELKILFVPLYVITNNDLHMKT